MCVASTRLFLEYRAEEVVTSSTGAHDSLEYRAEEVVTSSTGAHDSRQASFAEIACPQDASEHGQISHPSRCCYTPPSAALALGN